MSLGIGVTTTSNRNLLTQWLNKIAEVTIIDELVIAKDIKGISRAKNYCLARLDQHDHIVLFDDDCYPLVKDWHLPYINSNENHLSFTWRRKVLKTEGNLTHYELPDGQMLYINRKCLEVVGGFDEEYDTWGFEHVDYSQRVYNAGLTSAKYMDVTGSDKLFLPLDKGQTVRPSINNRHEYVAKNRARFEAQKDSKEFKAYK